MTDRNLDYAAHGPITSQQAPHVVVLVNHPCLLKTVPGSIRKFLQNYDQYARTEIARAKKLHLSISSTMFTDAVKPVDLKFCVDEHYLILAIALDFIKKVESFEALTNERLRTYLAEEAEESKNAVIIESLDALVEKELNINMENKNARFCMQGLFVDYHSLLANQGLTWTLKGNQKLAVSHVMSAIKQVSLRERLEPDLSFYHHKLRKDFSKFLAHEVKLSKAFQLVNAGSRKMKQEKLREERSGNKKGSRGVIQDKNFRKSKKTTRETNISLGTTSETWSQESSLRLRRMSG